MAAELSTIIMFTIAVAASLAASLLTPKPKGPNDKLGLTLPTAEDGEPIGLMFGTRDVKGQFIWPKRPGLMEKQKSGGDGGGKAGGGSSPSEVKWRLSFAIAYGWGPFDRIDEIRVDDCAVWRGPLDYDAGDHPNGYATLTPEGREGTIRFYFGVPGQVVDAKIDARETDAPRWPGIAYAVFDLFEVGSSPQVPNITVRARRTPQSPLANTDKLIMTKTADVEGCELYEANPVHVLAELATNAVYGLGLPTAKLDATSWNAAAALMADEGRGISLVLEKQEEFSKVAERILYHADAGIIWRSDVSLVKPVRQDYNPATVTEIAEASISAPKLTASTTSDVVNHLVCRFSSRKRFYRDSTFALQNVAHALATANPKRDTIDLPFFTVRSVAARVAKTKGHLVMVAHDVLEFDLDRSSGITLEWGDVIKVNWTAAGEDGMRLWRIVDLGRSRQGGRFAHIKAVEEIGNLAHSTTTIDEEDDEDPTEGQIVGPLTHELALELPWDVYQDESLRITHLAGRTQEVYSDLVLMGGEAGDPTDALTTAGRFVAAAGALVAEYPATTMTVDDTGFLVSGGTDLASLAVDGSVTRAELYQRKRLIAIGGELMAFQTITAEGDNYRIAGLIRGLADTTAQTHAAGASVLLMRDQIPFVVDGKPGWVDGTTLSLKALPYNEAQTGDAAEFSTRSLAISERAKRPYPVANVVADDVGSGHVPTYTAGGGAVRIGWVARNRGSGAGYSNPDGMFDANIAMETGMEFVARIYSGATLLRTITNTTGATYQDSRGVTRHYVDYDPATDSNPAAFTVKIFARINGWESAQSTNITVIKV
jgi:hypothetical protein